VIFLCNNNAWAISTPVRLQTAARSFAAKAEAFGFPGESVDGRDVLAVRDAVARARARAIAGDGPTLIEARAYRLGPHTTADDPGRYVPAAELEREKKFDCIDLFRHELAEAGIWDETMEQETRRDADARFDRALQSAEAATVRPDAFFDHVYDRPTARMERQRRELLEGLSQRHRHGSD
jgi:pyruvate dehydrogenase E1 component alpha subunit